MISCSFHGFPCSLHFSMPRSKNCGALSSDTPVVAVGRSAASGTPVVGFVGRNPSGAPNDQTESLVVEKIYGCNAIFSYQIESCLFFLGLSSATWTSAFYGYRIKRSKIVYEFHCVSFRHSMHFLLFRIFLGTALKRSQPPTGQGLLGRGSPSQKKYRALPASLGETMESPPVAGSN